SKIFNDGRAHGSNGAFPLNMLYPRKRYSKEGEVNNQDGNVPLRLLDDKPIKVRCVGLNDIFEGISPVKWLADKSSVSKD
ncbi:hypothetical protein Tco_0181729, partial [Tanacetum coccineum]